MAERKPLCLCPVCGRLPGKGQFNNGTYTRYCSGDGHFLSSGFQRSREEAVDIWNLMVSNWPCGNAAFRQASRFQENYDAARAMVADMAEALGGRVVWADAREGVCRWTDSPDGDGWTAACGWGCWMLPADATDQTRNGFCGGCGGRIETTDAGEGGE